MKDESMKLKIRDFESQILFFNGMYKLPIAPYPTVDKVIEDVCARQPALKMKDAVLARLAEFKKILGDELTEVDDIVLSITFGKKVKDGVVVIPEVKYTELEFLTDMADWLGDIQVYCASEMVRFGIPIKEVLKVIMSSNFSKLGADGKAIILDGKVQKGPGYWKPEPQIRQLLQERIEEAIPIKTEDTKDIVWRDPIVGEGK